MFTKSYLFVPAVSRLLQVATQAPPEHGEVQALVMTSTLEEVLEGTFAGPGTV